MKMSRIFSYADVVKKQRMKESRKNPFLFYVCLFFGCIELAQHRLFQVVVKVRRSIGKPSVMKGAQKTAH